MREGDPPPGMTAAPDLPRRLREADGDELLVLLREVGTALDAAGVRQALRNPFVTVEVIELLMRQTRLLAIYEVRSAIARHPRTPQVHALRFVPGLFWRELMEMTLDVRILPVVRRSAERNLVQRLPGLTLGEKMSLARRAGPGVLGHLRWEAEPRVLRALLENPRTTEGLLLPLAGGERATPEALREIAGSSRWGRRYVLRAALCRNPRTPPALALRLLGGLKKVDVRQVAQDLRLSAALRTEARRRLGLE